MDTPFDPVSWALGTIAAFLLVAVLITLGTFVRCYLTTLYLGRTRQHNERAIHKDLAAGALMPSPVPRSAVPESRLADKPAIYCRVCGARISAEGAYCQWCGRGEKTPTVEPATTPAFQQPDEASSRQSDEPSTVRVVADAAEPTRPVLYNTVSSSPVLYDKAPLGRRYAAFLIDAFIAAGPGLTAVALMVLAMSMAGAVDRSRAVAYVAMPLMLMSYVLMLVGVVWFVVYTLVKDSWRKGHSLGKRLCGLMVIDIETNEPCNRRQSAIRAIGLFLPLTQVLDPVLVLHDAGGRRVGDHLAGTQVIESSN